jgi:predicted glycogen debranching enzyme
MIGKSGGAGTSINRAGALPAARRAVHGERGGGDILFAGIAALGQHVLRGTSLGVPECLRPSPIPDGLRLGQVALLILGRASCGDWQTASRYEWLVTNGLGGFACGTVAGANTRRYHGFLVASLRPPVERVLLVSKVELSVQYQGTQTDLSANEFTGGVISGLGFEHLESFSIRQGIPTWRYAVADALLEQQIFMAPGANSSYLGLTLLRASAPLRVTFKPFVTYRDYHSQNRGAQALQVQSQGGTCTIRAFDGARPYCLSVSHGQFDAAAQWYWNFWHRIEAERGLDAAEDLLMPGSFAADLSVAMPVYFLASAEAAPPATAQAVLDRLNSGAQQLAARVPPSAPPWLRTLAQASEQFVVRRTLASGVSASSIIAGYPWFADWGRDTMISLPGLATALGRYELAAAILDAYASFVDGGMLPNCFTDSGEPPAYNTADATLWMFHALDDYLQAHSDPALAKKMLPILMQIIQAHADGTRYGIRVDPADGLLRAGETGTQLTWMDAKHGDEVFTPRIGKPVEINALWLNALDVAARLARQQGDSGAKSCCESLLARAGASFARFWNAERGCLYDVIDVDGGSDIDARLRPNQILALSLPYCVLDAAQMRSVVDCCGRELLMSYGLRSLSPREPGYLGRYQGGPQQRDAAYHMGTAWTWLLGPFARAHYRAYGDARRAQAFLDPVAQHVDSDCVGTLSEIFDGDAPHSARGCFAQAWSVAEILRSWIYLERRISTG